jgi:hypothetical protein
MLVWPSRLERLVPVHARRLGLERDDARPADPPTPTSLGLGLIGRRACAQGRRRLACHLVMLRP